MEVLPNDAAIIESHPAKLLGVVLCAVAYFGFEVACGVYACFCTG